MIDLVDEREVLVAFLPRELVDANRANAIQVAVCESPTDRVLDAPEDRVPRAPESTSGLAPRKHTSPVRQEPRERERRLHLARCPWHHLDSDAAAHAVDPPHGVHDEDRHRPEWDECETARRERVIARPLLTAVAAVRPRPDSGA